MGAPFRVVAMRYESFLATRLPANTEEIPFFPVTVTEYPAAARASLKVLEPWLPVGLPTASSMKPTRYQSGMPPQTFPWLSV
jgi:hypothetical protein